MALELNKDTEKSAKSQNNSKGVLFRDIFGGNIASDFLGKQIGLIVMILCMIFFYISNRYECQQKMVDIVSLQKKLLDVKYQALTRSSELMGGSKLSIVKELIVDKGIDLEESQTPPYSITKQIEN